MSTSPTPSSLKEVKVGVRVLNLKPVTGRLS